MGRSLSAPSIITPSRMTSNGFARRKIITTAGAYNFALPSEVTECDIAIFGAGGGGALLLHKNNNSVFIPGGAGGGGFSRRRYRNLAGGIVSGAVGARGLGGNVANADIAGSWAGANGGTTTATLNGITQTATGGVGGIIETTRTDTRVAGGVGSGGDINADGGRGGLGAGWMNSSQLGGFPSNAAPGGGGSSGSHVGTGGDGGDAYMGANGSTVYATAGAGGGWGGKGANALAMANGTGLISAGGTSKGPGLNQYGTNFVYGFFGVQDAEMMTISLQNAASTQPVLVPRLPNWWDIEDNGCASASGWHPKYGQAAGYPGGLGSGGSSQFTQEIARAGFGGGASGRGMGMENVDVMDWGVKDFAGVGGGGGGLITQGSIETVNGSTVFTAGTKRGIPGGPGCVIIWY